MTARDAIHSARALRRGSQGLLSRLAVWLAVGRQRRALARLDDHLLRDIGVPRHVAAEEAARPFWDVPEGWKA